MKTVTLSSKNQVVIPKEVRKKLHLSEGDKLVIKRITKNGVVFEKQPSYHEFLGIAEPLAKDPVTRIREVRNNWR